MESQSKRPDKKLKAASLSPLLVAAILIAAALIVVLAISGHKSPAKNSASSSNNANSVPEMPISGAHGLYLSPAGGSYASGVNFTIQVRENSGQTLVNAVQANLTYPADLLKINNINTSASKFKVQAENQSGNGQILLALGSTTPILGDQIIAQVSFQAITAGSASVAFTSGSALVNASTHQPVNNSLPQPVTYTIR